MFGSALKAGISLMLMATPGLVRAASYDDVVKLLEKSPTTGQPVASVEELLPLLPAELRKNFTFVYESRSPHGGLGSEADRAVTPLHPRVVLFSSDARLVLAFTGDPAKPGYDSVEMIRFEDKSASFVLTQHVLPAAVKRGGRLAEEAKHNGQSNPAQCLRCHGQDPRPFTDSYPLWPGFYGSVRDTFPKGSPEGPLYRKFLAAQKNKGVYKFLDWPGGTSTPPYLDPKRYDANKTVGSLDDMKFLPNTRLGMALTELNRKRIQRKIAASPRYEQLKHGLLAGFLGCRTLPISEAAVERMYAEIVVENADRIRRLGTHPLGPGAGDLNMMEIGFYGNVVQLDYLAAALGIGRRDWSMAFEDNSLSYFDGILSSIYEDKDFYLKEDFMLELLKDMAASDEELRPHFKTYAAYTAQGFPFGERLDIGAALGACAVLLRKQGETALPEIAVATAVRGSLPATAEPLLARLGMTAKPYARCLTCHSGDGALHSGRKIPFDRPAELAELLGQKAKSTDRTLQEEIVFRVSSSGFSRMPPREALSEAEKGELERYLGAVR